MNAEIIIIATPTDYDEITNKFDTGSVDNIVDEIFQKKIDPIIIIKSTVPEGHTEHLQKKYNSKKIIFSPEFLREGQALHDNLYPSRIVVGGSAIMQRFSEDFLKSFIKRKY